MSWVDLVEKAAAKVQEASRWRNRVGSVREDKGQTPRRMSAELRDQGLEREARLALAY